MLPGLADTLASPLSAQERECDGVPPGRAGKGDTNLINATYSYRDRKTISQLYRYIVTPGKVTKDDESSFFSSNGAAAIRGMCASSPIFRRAARPPTHAGKQLCKLRHRPTVLRYGPVHARARPFAELMVRTNSSLAASSFFPRVLKQQREAARIYRSGSILLLEEEEILAFVGSISGGRRKHKATTGGRTRQTCVQGQRRGRGRESEGVAGIWFCHVHSPATLQQGSGPPNLVVHFPAKKHISDFPSVGDK